MTVHLISVSDPCSSIGLWNDLIIGGFGSGHLRVFNASSGKLCVEASAHAKWINAIDVAKSTGTVSASQLSSTLSSASLQILTASEDTFIRVWKLSSGSSVKVL
jgi:WD40 repeat protein